MAAVLGVAVRTRSYPIRVVDGRDGNCPVRNLAPGRKDVLL